MISVVISPEQLKKAQRTLDRIKDGSKKAMAAALNRTIRTGRTEVSRATREVYTIKQKDLYETLTTTYASAGGGMRAEVRSKFSGMLPTWEFKVAPRRINSGRLLTASVKVGGGGSLGRAFVGQMKSGHVGVFVRTGSGRLPVRELRTISAPIMISQAPVAEPAIEKMQETFDRRLEHEMGRLLASAG